MSSSYTAAETTLVYVFGGSSFVLSIAAYAYVLYCVPPAVGQDPGYRRRLQYHLMAGSQGRWIEGGMALFSILSCVTFVWETYLTDVPLWMFCSELLFSMAFFVNYCVFIYAAQNRRQYFFSLQSFIDVATVPPVLYLFFSGSFTFGSTVGVLRFSRMMKFARVLRLLRIMRTVNVMSANVATTDAITNQLITFMTTIMSLMVITTGFVQYVGNEVENEPGDWGSHEGPVQFHDAMYFTIVTFGLVGYGDFAPRQVIGRTAMCFVIVAAFAAIPAQMNALVTKFRMRPGFSGSLNVAYRESHVVVTADITCSGIAGFLAEFFHEDHGSASASKVCVMMPGDPPLSVQELILKYKRVTFLRGDVTNTFDAHRARIDSADAVFVLADRLCEDPPAQDSLTVLRTLNIRAFNPRARVFVQILDPGHVRHVVMAGVPHENILCVGRTKMSLIGMSTTLPGIAAMVMNLVQSTSAKVANRAAEGGGWQSEYAAGLSQEIYFVDVPESYMGQRFSNVASDMYTLFDITLFGVRVIEDGHCRVILNPGRFYRLQPGDVAFLIAEDQQQVDNMVRLKGTAVAETAHSYQLPAWMSNFRTASATKDVENLLELQRDEYMQATGKSTFTSQMTRKLSMFGSTRITPSPGKSHAGGSSAKSAGKRAGMPGHTVGKLSKVDSVGGLSLGSSTKRIDESELEGEPEDSSDDGSEGHDKLQPLPEEKSTSMSDLSESKRMKLAALVQKKSLRHVLTPEQADKLHQGLGAGAMVSRFAKATTSVMNSRKQYDLFGRVKYGFKRVSKGRGLRAGASSSCGWLAVRRILSDGLPQDHEDETFANRMQLRERLLSAVVSYIDDAYDSVPVSSQEHDTSFALNPVAVDVVRCLAEMPAISQAHMLSRTIRAEQLADLQHLTDLSSAVGHFSGEPVSPLPEHYADTYSGLLHGHVIVVCSEVASAQYIVAPLRDASLPPTGRPIVFFVPAVPTRAEWDHLAPFAQIYVVVGEQTKPNDLIRAGIETCSTVIILSDPSHGRAYSSSGDAQVILTSLVVESTAPNARIVSEMNQAELIQHLGNPTVSKLKRHSARKRLLRTLTRAVNMVNRDSVADPKQDYVFQMAYASGDVIGSAFLEALICQAFFNPHIISVANALLSNCHVTNDSEAKLAEQRTSHWYSAMGFQALEPLSASTDAMALDARLRPIRSQSGEDDDSDDQDRRREPAVGGRVESSRLSQVHVPQDFVKKSFGELFEAMLQVDGTVIIGILRAPKSSSPTQVLPYVVTSPPRHAVLNSNDLLFILAPRVKTLAPG